MSTAGSSKKVQSPRKHSSSPRSTRKEESSPEKASKKGDGEEGSPTKSSSRREKPAASKISRTLSEKKSSATPVATKDKEREKDAKEKEKEKESKEKEKQKETEKKKGEKEKSSSARPVFPDTRDPQTKADDAGLEEIKLDAQLVKATESNTPPAVYEAFHKLLDLARDLNAFVEEPEIVFIGPRGAGKSALLESFLGHPFGVLGRDGANRRPIFIRLINNPACEKPKITMKRDQLKAREGGEFAGDREVRVKDVPAEIEKRNAKYSAKPIHINYEWKHCWNMTLIDTPGLIFEAESSDDASLSNTGSNPGEKTRDRIESMVLELVQPSNRLIVCVEQAQGWGSCKMPSFMSKVDPSSYRTTYVYTNFYNNVLKVLASSQETNRYLGNQPAPRSTFFVSLFSAYMRQSSKKSFGELVVAAFQRDHQQLEHVRYNKTYAHAIGLPAFRSHLVERTRKQYLDTIPKLCKYFDGLRLNATTKLQHLQHSLSELESHRLRSVATTYVMEFLHVLSKLISGSAEALPSINGETSFDEQAVVGEWVNGKKEVIEVEESWGVSYLTNKLYGGQQFERLLSEFVAVCDHSRPIQPSVDDVANASGGKAMKEFSQYAWTVSEIVQRHAQTELYPLIEQLLDRALHVFVRLFPIAEVLVATHRKAKAAGKRSPLVQLDAAFDDEAQPELGGDLYGVSSGGAVGGSKKELLSTTSLEDLPYFHQRLREFYLNFVNRCAQICREKCVDEFCSTRIIYWELSSFPSKSLRIKNTQSAKQSRDKVGQLAVALWDQIKQRTSHNIALKCHHFFLVPMETELAGELQGQFSSLSDGEVEELFEVDTLRKALQKEKKQVEEALARHEAKEKAFRQAAALFSSRKH